MSSVQQSYHHGNLKTALLEEAKKHLKSVGPDKLSLRALARDLGVSQTAPYRHFADKTELLAALAAEGFRKLNEVTENSMAGVDKAVDKLRYAGRAYVCFATNNADLYRLMFGPLIPPNFEYAELREAGNSSFESIVSLIEMGIKSGEFRQEDPMILAHSTWSMVHGLASLLIDGRFDCSEYDFGPEELDRALAITYEGMKP